MKLVTKYNKLQGKMKGKLSHKFVRQIQCAQTYKWISTLVKITKFSKNAQEHTAERFVATANFNTLKLHTIQRTTHTHIHIHTINSILYILVATKCTVWDNARAPLMCSLKFH